MKCSEVRKNTKGPAQKKSRKGDNRSNNSIPLMCPLVLTNRWGKRVWVVGKGGGENGPLSTHKEKDLKRPIHKKRGLSSKRKVGEYAFFVGGGGDKI